MDMVRVDLFGGVNEVAAHAHGFGVIGEPRHEFCGAESPFASGLACGGSHSVLIEKHAVDAHQAGRRNNPLFGAHQRIDAG
jgi:hypothetical protein